MDKTADHQKPPFFIYTGNKTTLFDVTENPTFGSFAFFFSRSKETIADIGFPNKYYPCDNLTEYNGVKYYCSYFNNGLYTSRSDPQSIYTLVKGAIYTLVGGSNFYLYRSNDGGKNFTFTQPLPDVKSVFRIFPICDNGSLIIGADRELGPYKRISVLLKSADKGATWQELGAYPQNDSRYVVLTADGRYLIGGQMVFI